MLQSVRKHVAVAAPQIPVKALLSLGCIGSFAVLLAQDRVHPFVVYLLQLYLSF
ncbi:MAG TPA: hypothetical protein VF017_01290 [Thermoanaerobaculia bacterium]|nr:hypothetical protein [Thermoanaerobaculia bacterium]